MTTLSVLPITADRTNRCAVARKNEFISDIVRAISRTSSRDSTSGLVMPEKENSKRRKNEKEME